jgi:hypothetical protein
MRKTGIIIGAAAGTLGLILIIKSRASGGGNGGGPKYSFDFGVPVASRDAYPPAPGWSLLNFDCEVHNPHDVEVQRTLEIWWRWRIDPVPGFPDLPLEGGPQPLQEEGYSALALSLSPGESVTYHYSGMEHYDSGTVFLMAQEMYYWFRLQDDLGNHSPEVYMSI